MDFIELCRKLISIDTSPSHGNLEAATWLAEYAKGKGLSAELQTEFIGELEQANVIIRLDEARPDAEFMFETHLDTPDPGPFGLWNKTGQNPFDAHIIDGEIYGLGAADCKLDFLCKLQALIRLKESGVQPKALPPVLVGTFGEESGMTGALRLIRKNKVRAKYALIGEASENKLLTAGNGYGLVEIHVPFEHDEVQYREDHNLRENSSTISKTFTGKSAHSSTPDRGESAIEKMIEFLNQLPEDIAVMEISGGINANTVPAQAFFEFDTFNGLKMPMAKKLNLLFRDVRRLRDEFLLIKDPDFSPASPTMNVGSMRTTDAGVSISTTVRLPPVVSNEAYESWMERLLTTCKGLNAEVRFVDYKRPYRIRRDSEFVQATQKILGEVQATAETGTHSSTNEASLFSRVGMECISFGPGMRDSSVHTPNEHAKISDLQAATEFYYLIMQRMCL